MSDQYKRSIVVFFFFQAEDGIRDGHVTGVQTCALPISHTRGAAAHGAVIRGDATLLSALLPTVLHGQVALVVTSPPYGPTVHGLVRPGADGVAKFDNSYNDGTDKNNLAYRDLPGLVDGFTDILRGCATMLKPGGNVVVTARPWRKHANDRVRDRRTRAQSWCRPSPARCVAGCGPGGRCRQRHER